MLEIPKDIDILEYFFKEVKEKGKYEIKIDNNSAYIIPREEEKYYKPVIIIPDTDYFRILIMEYINSINDFNKRNNSELEAHQGLSYVMNIMLFNLTPSDAEDLNKFLETRISFLKDNKLSEYEKPKKVFEYEDATFYAQREVEDFGLETPYIMTFSMEEENNSFQMPIIRYGFAEDGTCYIYAVQIGRKRTCDTTNPNYKKIVNKVNQGVKENRDISPSFVLILAMFIKILSENGIKKIVIPDYLFSRYKKYYHANTTNKSDEILSRMFHSIIGLVDRMNTQIEGVDIKSYPLDADSYYHIELKELKSNNKILQKLFNEN